VQKTWGWEEWRINNEKYCLKILGVYKGAWCSLHRHPKKDETFYCFFGKVLVWTEPRDPEEGSFHTLEEGDTVRIYPGKWHSFYAPGNITGIQEVSTHHSDEDVERLSESAFGTEDDWRKMIESTRKK